MQPAFEADEEHATHQGCPGHRCQRLGQFQSRLFHGQPADGSHHERCAQLEEIVLIGRFTPAGQQDAHSIGEDRHHRQHRAHLDHGVEEIRVVAAGQTFGDEQVTGGGHRQELGDTFNDAEQCGEEPFRHG